tara:strand:+ start:423 stop:755 length:333 start_codon:yes stop_codon:yes gene_type:complete
MKTILTFCSKSIVHFKNLLYNDNAKYIFIGIKGGGCNGFKYYIKTYNSLPKKSDEIIVVDDDLSIIVCGKSILHLLGTHVHWKMDSLGARVEFNNPNAQSTCGCGETFSL